MKRTLCLAIFAVVLWTSAAFAVTSSPTPGPEAVSRGISSYEVTDFNDARSVIMTDESGQEVARVIAMQDVAGVERYELNTPGGEQLSVTFDQVGGSLQLTDGTATGTARIDAQNREWVGDIGFERLLQRRGSLLELVGIVISDLKGAPKETEECGSSPGDSEPMGGMNCNGYQCRGFSIDSANSWCCEEAWQDASNCCSNGACWGCCRFLDCDFHCAIGRYFCFCGVSGISCSYKVF